MKKINNKIVLGTAQFGGRYGVAKKKVNDIQFKKIITFSKKNNIKELDTARNYGNCEKRLKKSKNIDAFKITTKIFFPKISNKKPEDYVRFQINKIIKNLNVKKIYCVLIHNPTHFSNRRKYFDALKKLKQEGLIKNIGFSVYDTKNLKNIIKNYKFDIIQLPYSIIDRRFENEGYLKILKRKGIKIYARSIFLQGLLLSQYNQIPNKFIRNSYAWNLWHYWLKVNKLSPIDVCLNFVNSNKYIDKIILGVHQIDQLKEIINFKRKKIEYPMFFPLERENALNPLRWNTL